MAEATKTKINQRLRHVLNHQQTFERAPVGRESEKNAPLLVRRSGRRDPTAVRSTSPVRSPSSLPFNKNKKTSFTTPTRTLRKNCGGHTAQSSGEPYVGQTKIQLTSYQRVQQLLFEINQLPPVDNIVCSWIAARWGVPRGSSSTSSSSPTWSLR